MYLLKKAMLSHVVTAFMTDFLSCFHRCSFSLVEREEKLPEMFIYMLKQLLPDEDCRQFLPPLDIQARFVCTVRNNYRDIFYHNWNHGMTVTHAMYSILHNNMTLFDPVERLALLVACACHDLDHRGLGNHFLQKVHHPLAMLYPSSTMEQHHYHVSLDILSRNQHDIFGHLKPQEKEKALNLLHHAILSTDLSLHFSNRQKIEQLLASGEFDISIPNHR